MLPTCLVHCAVHDNDGSPIEGAIVTAILNRHEVYQGYVVPIQEMGTTDASGTCILPLWPNALGATESSYDVRILAPGGKALRLVATVPNVSNANLHEIANLPPYEGKSDGQLIIDAAVAAVAPAVAAQLAAEAARDTTLTAEQNVLANTATVQATADAVSADALLVSTKASEASSSAYLAQTAATAATDSASAAAASETASAASALAASNSATLASNKEAIASAAAVTATNEAAAALNSRQSAEIWAAAALTTKQDTELLYTAVQGYRDEAVSAKTQAANSASEALNQVTLIQAYAADAKNSKTLAAVSEAYVASVAVEVDLDRAATTDALNDALLIYGSVSALQAAQVAAEANASDAINSKLDAEAAVAQIETLVTSPFTQFASDLIRTQTLIAENHAFN